MGMLTYMGRLLDRLGRFDEEKRIYPTKDGGFAWRRFAIGYVIGSIVVGGLILGLGLLVGEAAAAASFLVISVVGVIAYVVWRRDRNRRLTGSPTKWPEGR